MSPVRTARLLGAAASTLDDHRRLAGPVPWRGGVGRLIGDVQSAGLTGRGAAGTASWRELATVATTERPVVVANAAEGDPAPTKDTALLTRCPHLVLDGLQLAVETVGATAVYLYVRPGPAARTARAALAERAAQRWDLFPVRVVEAEQTLAAGEESTVLARIFGRRQRSLSPRRSIVRSGPDVRAALVQNVETLAHLAQLARHGPAWFRRLGTATEPGTFLAAVSGAVDRPEVYEAPVGAPASVLLDLAGGATDPVQAVLVGGAYGTWLPAAELGHTPLSRAGLARFGGAPGTGGLLALSQTRCGLAETARIVRYLVEQRGRQCGPCRTGLPVIAGRLDELVHGRGDVTELSTVVSGRGACAHLDGCARLVRGALDVFAAEVRLHLGIGCPVAIAPIG